MWGLVLILVIILITLFVAYWNSNFIEGMWLADPDFCDLADIGMVAVYFGPNENMTPIWQKRKCWILVQDYNGEPKINHLTMVNMSGFGTFSCKFEDSPDELVFPLNQTMKLNDDYMSLSDNDTTSFVGTRDTTLSKKLKFEM